MSCCGRCKVCRHEWEELEARIEALMAIAEAADHFTDKLTDESYDALVYALSLLPNPSDHRADAQETK